MDFLLPTVAALVFLAPSDCRCSEFCWFYGERDRDGRK